MLRVPTFSDPSHGLANAGSQLLQPGMQPAHLASPRLDVNAATRSLLHSTRRARGIGLLVTFAFVGGFAIWSAVVPLAGGVVAEGLLRAQGKTRTVQHLEGGIVEAIHVRNGDKVVAGQALVTLSQREARGNAGQMRNVWRNLLTKQARLTAEQFGLAQVVYPAELLADAKAMQFMEIQNALFQARRSAHEAQAAALKERDGQLQQALVALRVRLETTQQQRELVQEEVTDKEGLLARGLARKPDVLRLQRSAVDLDGRIGEIAAQTAMTQGEAAEIAMRISALQGERAGEIAKELAEVSAAILATREQIDVNDDIIHRAVVTAPVDGYVANSKIHTIGGTLMPGEGLLDIVPADETLIIEAQIGLNDVDNIQPGQQVVISLPGYPAASMPRLSGVVLTLAADSIVDQRSGKAHFYAEVGIDLADMANRAPHVVLRSGMAAQILIVTEMRTLGRRLFDPFLRALQVGMREP